MNYSCSVHVLLVHQKTFCRCCSHRPRDVYIKFPLTQLTSKSHLNTEMSNEDEKLRDNF